METFDRKEAKCQLKNGLFTTKNLSIHIWLTNYNRLCAKTIQRDLINLVKEEYMPAGNIV